MCISPLDNAIVEYKVSLEASLVWTIREMRLHKADNKDSIELDIKLDGLPFYGKYTNRAVWQLSGFGHR